MQKIKVLLVDDHQLIRSGMRSIIHTSDYILIEAECKNGKEAINYLQKNSTAIDVILMDITMPEINGIEATQLITKQYPNIRTLALTMHAEEPYIMKMIDAGALGYILKDASREKIIEAINTVYNKDRYYSNEVSVKLINTLLAGDKKKELLLSKRELQLLNLIVNGITSTVIGKELNISGRTVETHKRNIIRKLNLKNTAELVRYALKNDLIIPNRQ